jgi:hypothetical protein
MLLKTKRQNAMTPQQNNLRTHFTQQKHQIHTRQEENMRINSNPAPSQQSAI